MASGIETYAGNDKVRDVILTKLAGDDLVELFAVQTEVETGRGGYANLNARLAAIEALVAGGLPEAAFTDPFFADLLFDGASGPDVVETITTNNRHKRVRQFSGSSTQDVFFSGQVPIGYGTVKFKVKGIITNATGPSSEGMAFGLKGYCSGDGDPMHDTDGAEIIVTHTGLTMSQYDVFETDWSAAVTITNIAQLEEAMLVFRRIHDNAADTYAQKVGVEKVVMNWKWVA